MRLHYVYPYPHVDEVIPLMAEGVLPYLECRSSMRAQGAQGHEATRERSQGARATEEWRSIVPEIAIRSSFVVGFPGETEEDFETSSAGSRKHSSTASARPVRAGAGRRCKRSPRPVPEAVKEERYERVMELSARISAEKLSAKVGKTLDVLIDRVDESSSSQEDGPDRGHFDAPHPQHHHGIGATGRSKADAPEIDGEVHLRDAGRPVARRHRLTSASKTPTSMICSASRSPPNSN